MKRFRLRWLDLMIFATVAGLAALLGATRTHEPKVAPSDFAAKVRLQPLYQLAVQADGRLRSFESHAKSTISYITGGRLIGGQTYGVTYLDLIFRPEAYHDAEIIYIKNKEVRQQIIDAAGGHMPVDPASANRMMKTGLFSRPLLTMPPVASLLDRLGRDLIRTAKVVDAIEGAMHVAQPDYLLSNLRIVPPPSGDVGQPWISIDEIVGASAPQDDAHRSIRRPASLSGLSEQTQQKLAESWQTLASAWRQQDVPKVDAAIEDLAAAVHALNSLLYPSPKRLEMESWYFRYKSMTWVWLFYLAAVPPLLMSVIYRWNWARVAGIALFTIAFLAHCASVAIRWYISGRWPNANMFEAVTTAAWFGGVGALILEWVARRSPMRSLFALGSAIMSMLALMAAYFLPAQLDSSINNKMAALNDVWLYIHTNMIIWSYAVIGLACIPAALLLRHRWCQLWDTGAIPRPRLLLLPISIVVLNYAGYKLLMMAIDPVHYALPRQTFLAVLGAFWGALLCLGIELLSAKSRRAAGFTVDRAAVGGAASLVANPLYGGSFLKSAGPTPTQIFDGATMVLVELAFIMLWTGTIMGAIWADHSWGRPWGWDPKEVFALNTFLIFLILIHVRLKVRDKAFWTAVLAVVGFEVMMFNWIVVNFVISGLHSYA